MSQEEFSRAFTGSPMKRAKLRGLKRNAAVVLGNLGTATDVDVLTRALNDPESLVRRHVVWALGRIASSAALEVLRKTAVSESDPDVLAAIAAAMESLTAARSPALG